MKVNVLAASGVNGAAAQRTPVVAARMWAPSGVRLKVRNYNGRKRGSSPTQQRREDAHKQRYDGAV